MKKNIFFILLLVGISWYFWPQSIEENTNSLVIFKVKKGDFDVVLHKKGTAFPEKSYKLKHGIDLFLKITYLARNGKKVKKGQVVARVDSKNIINVINQIEENLSKELIAYELLQIEQDILEEKLKLSAVKKTLDEAQKAAEFEKYSNYEAELQQRLKNIEITQAKTTLNKINKKLNSFSDLIKEGLGSKGEYEKKRKERDEAKWKLLKAKMEYNLFVNFTKRLETKAKKNAANMARNLLNDNGKIQTIKQDQKKLEIMQKEMLIDGLKKDLLKHNNRLKKTTLHAPISGIVIHGDPDQNSRRIKKGRRTSSRTVIITIPDSGNNYIKLMVSEKEVYLLHKGMECKIKHGNKFLQGKISYVGESANSDNPSESFVIEIVAFENTHFESRSTIDVEIPIDFARDVLFVPNHAIHKSSGKFYCYIQTNKIEKRWVIIGKKGNFYTEIKDGLSVGEKVFLGTRN